MDRRRFLGTCLALPAIAAVGVARQPKRGYVESLWEGELAVHPEHAEAPLLEQIEEAVNAARANGAEPFRIYLHESQRERFADEFHARYGCEWFRPGGIQVPTGFALLDGVVVFAGVPVEVRDRPWARVPVGGGWGAWLPWNAHGFALDPVL